MEEFMRRLAGLAILLVCAACAEQSVADPCTIRLNLPDVPNTQVNASRTIALDLDVRSGTCSNTDREVTWASSKPLVAELTSSNNNGATFLAKSAGSSVVSVWLTRGPSTRDSVTVNVTAPADN
jgi:hypothetical protein